jgi:hypothetical protein
VAPLWQNTEESSSCLRQTQQPLGFSGFVVSHAIVVRNQKVGSSILPVSTSRAKACIAVSLFIVHQKVKTTGFSYENVLSEGRCGIDYRYGSNSVF